MTHDPTETGAAPVGAQSTTEPESGRSEDPRDLELVALRARIAELERGRAGVEAQLAAERACTTSLRQQLKLLKDILDNSTAVIFVRNTAGRYLLVNRRYEELFRTTNDQIAGKTDFDLFPKRIAEEFYANDMQVLAGGSPVELEEVVPSDDGVQTYITLKFPIRDLDGTIYAVCGIATDITERKRAEQERAALQQQIIRTQEVMVRELSTPLIPLADGVLVMPIIGTIDSGRAQQIMQTLLTGIAGERTRIAILDITAVQIVDTQVANALLQAARAARLLGAEVVLTGIGARVAQTLVQLGADLSSVVTLSTLQSGIAYALGRRR